MTAVAEHTDYNQYNTQSEYNSHSLPPKTLGFDLRLELDYINQKEKPIGERTVEEIKEERFIRNAETYIDEALHVGIAKYDPYRITNQDGEIVLTADNYEGPVREIFNPHNPKLKDKWPLYRKTPYHQQRAEIEYERFKDMEQSLQSAETGDTFIWISPPPYEIVNAPISIEEKKKLLEDQGFGFHTNTFIFTVEENNTLQGRVIQNYLRPENHRELLRVLMNQDLFHDDVDELQLLNTIAKLPLKNIAAQDIKGLIDQIYDHTPDELKIKPTHAYEQQLWTDEENMKNIHQHMRPFLQYVFQLLKNTNIREIASDQELQDFIAMRFHIWEQTVIDLHKGKPVDFQGVQNILDLNSEALQHLATSEIQILKNRKSGYGQDERHSSNTQKLNQYAVFVRSQNKDADLATGCGIGSGFSGGSGIASTIPFEQSVGALPTNYIGAEILRAKTLGIEIRHGDYPCPKCKTKITGEIIGSHPSTWTKRCPNDRCKYEFKCAQT